MSSTGDHDEENLTRSLRCRRRHGWALRLSLGRTYSSIVRDSSKFVAEFNDDHVARKHPDLHGTSDDDADDDADEARSDHSNDTDHRTTDDDDRGADDDDRGAINDNA